MFIQKHYITFQDINLQAYFKIVCLKSVLWPNSINNVVDVSLSVVSLGIWTACNHDERNCTVCQLSSAASGMSFGVVFFYTISEARSKRAGSWRCCLGLEVVTSIPTGSTIIHRFLCGFIRAPLCQRIEIKTTNYNHNHCYHYSLLSRCISGQNPDLNM